MSNSAQSFISAKQLSKRSVRFFYDTLLSRLDKNEILPGDTEKFDSEGIALIINDELRGIYTYKAFPSLKSDTIIYYPFGGTLIEDRYTKRHHEIIERLIHQLKGFSKVQIIMSLDQQSIQEADKINEHEAFWLKQGFSRLDAQVHYQGTIKRFQSKDELDFLVTKYAGGNHDIDAEICHLYRQAYKNRIGIPDISPDSISQQLKIPSCTYLITQQGDELIGQASLFIHDKECYVDSIHIKRRYWGTGAADTLVRSLFNYAKKNGCEIVSGSAASNNQASRSLMERFGLVAKYQIKRMVLTL
jgi:ribosomal protein S18 acetylase RimI-like enzyme